MTLYSLDYDHVGGSTTIKKIIMVFDVSAESGGALTILSEFYSKCKTECSDNEYVFVLSKPILENTDNIRIMRFPWIKTSWFHRLYFDYFIAPILIRKFNVSDILSLQNTIIPNTNIPQTVYVHNALPFVKQMYRFPFFKEPLLWIYQNILGQRIFKSIRDADRVIVQTEWMKKACINEVKIPELKVEVISPRLDVFVKDSFSQDKDRIATFIYPASGAAFKNHDTIVKACIILKKEEIKGYRVLFTLDEKENSNVAKLYKKVKSYELPISFIGRIRQEEVYRHYSHSILLFSSYIETIGLPLIEAKMHGTPIIVSDCDFAHEVLATYGDAYYFKPFAPNQLATHMKRFIRSS